MDDLSKTDKPGNENLKRLDKDLERMEEEAKKELQKKRNKFADTQDDFSSQDKADGFYKNPSGQREGGKAKESQKPDQQTKETINQKPQFKTQKIEDGREGSGEKNDEAEKEKTKISEISQKGEDTAPVDKGDVNFKVENKKIPQKKQEDKGKTGKTILVVFLILLFLVSSSFLGYYLGTRSDTSKPSLTPMPTIAPTQTPKAEEKESGLNLFTSLDGILSFKYPNDFYLETVPGEYDATLYPSGDERETKKIHLLIKDNPDNLSISDWLVSEERDSKNEISISAGDEEIELTELKLQNSKINWMVFGEIRPSLVSGEIYWAGKKGDKIIFAVLSNLDFSQYKQVVEEILSTYSLNAEETIESPTPASTTSPSV